METADTIFRQGRRVSEPIMRAITDVAIGDVRSGWYTGFINGANLLPGVGQDSDEFYRVARELSQWDMQSRLAISDQINAGTLTAAQEARFNNWRKESQYALELVVGLRERNINRVIIRAMARAENFGHAIHTQQNTGYQHIKYIGAFPVPDREATITQYTGLFGGGNAGREAAAAAYDEAMNAINADEESRRHWLAIASWRHSRVRMAGCGFYR
ncbi:hypothetical protein BJX63DRAFT_431633 [Aspergillus granulosus]|uniref:Uncharacterized protein n=1 Tax=Aspergillus granulosus TaxID=176169 RepID=A0ABR4HES9_9EURO